MNKRDVGIKDFSTEFPKFLPSMYKTYKILAPNMLPTHFAIFSEILKSDGFDVEILQNSGRNVIDEGLKHVHNDACYPALCVTGQFIDALKSGKYDVNRTALLITQSGGGCRASNYIPLIRKAVREEFPSVPVVSFNFSGLEKDSAFPMTVKRGISMMYAVFYGDIIASMYNQTKPYELQKGEADTIKDQCLALVLARHKQGGFYKLKKLSSDIIEKFLTVKTLPKDKREKIKVGIVGEIYVKYSPLGNNGLEKFLLSENAEPFVPALIDFVLYCIVNVVNDKKRNCHTTKHSWAFGIAYKYIYKRQREIIKIMQNYGVEPLHDFERLRYLADKVLDQGVKMGEGWLIPAEIAALAESGVKNVVCAQPFGCLPNHIVGKGAARTLKNMYKDENIVPIDYDPSATKVNQENRIRLMLAAARENAANKNEKAE